MATVVTGIASTPTIDGERHSVRPGALACDRTVPLVWRHEMSLSAGRILALWQDGDRLLVKALVDNDDAANTARGFSVNFSVESYEIVNKGMPSYYAVVTKARWNELSLVMDPCNPDCIILSREPYIDPTAAFTRANAAFHDAMARKIKATQELIKLCRPQA